MAKNILTAAEARALIVSLATERLERLETSLADQISQACAEGATETTWRTSLPDALSTKLTNNGYAVTESPDGFVISWEA